MSTSLNYFGGATQYGCCAFHIPSQELVNAFSTDVNGLPKFDTYNNVALTDADLTTNGVNMDPRVDHTIGIRVILLSIMQRFPTTIVGKGTMAIMAASVQ
jgi:hypothetical protein